jgi:hypothetical protein
MDHVDRRTGSPLDLADQALTGARSAMVTSTRVAAEPMAWRSRVA